MKSQVRALGLSSLHKPACGNVMLGVCCTLAQPKPEHHILQVARNWPLDMAEDGQPPNPSPGLGKRSFYIHYVMSAVRSRPVFAFRDSSL